MSISSRRRYKQEIYYNNKKEGVCVYCHKNIAQFERVGCSNCLKKSAKKKRNKKKLMVFKNNGN